MWPGDDVVDRVLAGAGYFLVGVALAGCVIWGLWV